MQRLFERDAEDPRPNPGFPRSRGVLIIAKNYPPFWTAGAHRIASFTRYLPEAGWTALVLTPSSGASPPPSTGDTRTRRTVASNYERLKTRILGVLESLSVPASARKAVRWLARKLDRWFERWVLIPDPDILWLTRALAEGRRILSQTPANFILASAPPPSMLIVGYVLACLHRKGLVLDFRDPWIGGKTYCDRSALRRSVEELLEGLVLGRASLIIANTERQRAEISRRRPALLSRLVVITNGLDPIWETIAPPEMDQGGGSVEILHCGHIYADLRNPLPFLTAMSLQLERDPTWRGRLRVTFLGAGEYVRDERFRSAVRSLGLVEAVVVHDGVPPEEVPGWVERAHVLLLLQNSDAASTQLPSKAYEYACSHRPTLALAPDGSETALFVQRHQLGVTEGSDEPERILLALQRVLQMRGDFRPRFDHRQFTRRSLTLQLGAHLDKLVQ